MLAVMRRCLDHRRPPSSARSVSTSFRRIRVAIAKINSCLQERMSLRIVVFCCGSSPRRARAARSSMASARAYGCFRELQSLPYGWFYPVVEFLSMLALAGILAYGGFRIGRGALTLGMVVAAPAGTDCASSTPHPGPQREDTTSCKALPGFRGGASSSCWDTPSRDPAAGEAREPAPASSRIEFVDLQFPPTKAEPKPRQPNRATAVRVA